MGKFRAKLLQRERICCIIESTKKEMSLLWDSIRKTDRKKQQEQKESYTRTGEQHGIFQSDLSVPIYARMPAVLRAFVVYGEGFPPQNGIAEWGTDHIFFDILRMG